MKRLSKLMQHGFAVVGFAAVGLALMAGAAQAANAPVATPTVLDCTNTDSGWEWTLAVDVSHGTVDQKPAQFSDTDIVWHDSDAGPNYDYDRTTGLMTKVGASSTGGYIITDKCTLK